MGASNWATDEFYCRIKSYLSSLNSVHIKIRWIGLTCSAGFMDCEKMITEDKLHSCYQKIHCWKGSTRTIRRSSWCLFVFFVNQSRRRGKGKEEEERGTCGPSEKDPPQDLLIFLMEHIVDPMTLLCVLIITISNNFQPVKLSGRESFRGDLCKISVVLKSRGNLDLSDTEMASKFSSCWH